MAQSNMELLETYFQTADTNHDGKLSMSEVMEFLRRFGLPNHVLAQIWARSDNKKTGFLGRTEFYNALRLVKLAQSGNTLPPHDLHTNFNPPVEMSTSMLSPGSSIHSPRNDTGSSAVGSMSGCESQCELDGDDTVSGPSQIQWPKISPSDINNYRKIFEDMDKEGQGVITCRRAYSLFRTWQISREIINKVLNLSDMDKDGKLTKREFFVAVYLLERHRQGSVLPSELPFDLWYDELLMEATAEDIIGDQRYSNQPAMSTSFGSTSSFNAWEQIDRLKEELFAITSKCRKAEGEVMLAQEQAKAMHTMYLTEMRRRKSAEEALENERNLREQQTALLQKQKDEYLMRLQEANKQRLAWAQTVAESRRTVDEREHDLEAFRRLLDSLLDENDHLKQERDALAQSPQGPGRTMNDEPIMSPEFSESELMEATQNFSATMRIGEGGFGCVYRGELRRTTVAVKVLHPGAVDGHSQFQQEVSVLSKMRHPHLVALVGVCQKSSALVYEYMPNGSLEDRLNCVNGTPPLTWQARTRIIGEVCSALVFLHESKPHPIVHGDLKPANILLDANFISKLGDFGISRHLMEYSSNNTAHHFTVRPAGTSAYVDPQFLMTGELKTSSDVYSFGVTVLRILTGKPAPNIAAVVKQEVDRNNLMSVIDASAGNWPYIQACQLADVGIRCANLIREDRPDLATDVWATVQPLMKLAALSRVQFSGPVPDERRLPPYFFCPILHDVMRDPQTAADGYTYEAEAIEGWFNMGRRRSPMTNLELPHQNLIPNVSLRSAIQEYFQQQQHTQRQGDENHA